MKDKTICFKLIFTSTFIGLFIFMICSEWAKENINNRSIAILLIAFLPWIIKYIKSIEMFGIKAELVSEKKMKEVDDIMQTITKEEIDKTFSNDSDDEEKNKDKKDNTIIHCDIYDSVLNAEDSISKLVLGKYELEKIIKKIAKKYNISTSMHTTLICKELYNQKYISDKEYSIIKEILPILNKAIHSEIDSVDEGQIDWIKNKIIMILDHLDYRYKTGKDFDDWLKI